MRALALRLVAGDESAPTVDELTRAATAANVALIRATVKATIAELLPHLASGGEVGDVDAGVVDEMLDALDAAESRAQRAAAQRDRLAEALRAVAATDPMSGYAMHDIARAALAEVEKP